jgi:hypothetical protein
MILKLKQAPKKQTKTKTKLTLSTSDVATPTEEVVKYFGVTCEGKWLSSKFVYGKIAMSHPDNGQRHVILIHKDNQDNIKDFKFIEGRLVEFEIFQEKKNNNYTAKNVRYIEEKNTKYSALLHKISQVRTKQFTWSEAKLIATVWVKFGNRNIVNSTTKEPLSMEKQVKYMIDKTLDDLGLSLVGYNRSKKSVILRTKDE